MTDELWGVLAAGLAVFAWFGVPLLAWWWWQVRGKAWFDRVMFNHAVNLMIREYRKGKRKHHEPEE